MSKIKTIALLPLLAVISSAYAGSMGPIVANTTPFVPFVIGEGSYTWNSVKGIFINGIESSETKNGWGGRVAAGLEYEFANNLGLTSELGWGYYGKVSNYLPYFNSNASLKIYGIDLLLGLDYTFNQFDIFVKAGAMFENVVMKSYQDLSLTFPGSSYGPVRNAGILGGAMGGTIPEVKAGAIYNINDQLGVSVAYMYASGYTLKASNYVSPTPTGDVMQSPFFQGGQLSLSSVMFGLRYNFA